MRNSDCVFISYYVDILDSNPHLLDWRMRKHEVEGGYPNLTVRGSQHGDTAPIELRDSLWLGKRAVVLSGCQLAVGSVVGTRAVVTVSCPEDSSPVGNPASVQLLRGKGGEG